MLEAGEARHDVDAELRGGAPRDVLHPLGPRACARPRDRRRIAVGRQDRRVARVDPCRNTHGRSGCAPIEPDAEAVALEDRAPAGRRSRGPRAPARRRCGRPQQAGSEPVEAPLARLCGDLLDTAGFGPTGRWKQRERAANIRVLLSGTYGADVRTTRSIASGVEDVLDHHDRRARRRRRGLRAGWGPCADRAWPIGSERRMATSRHPASSCWWASAMSPPITIAAGVEEVHRAPQGPSPRWRPGVRGRSGSPAGSPERTSATTSRLVPAATPASLRAPGERAAAGDGRRGSRRCRSGKTTSSWPGDADVADVARRRLGRRGGCGGRRTMRSRCRCPP